MTETTKHQPGGSDLKELLKSGDPTFFQVLRDESVLATQFQRALSLHTLRRRALALGMDPPNAKAIKLAVIGGSSLRPLADLIEHFVTVLAGFKVELWAGDYDNYISEVMDEGSELYEFGPEVVFILPSEARCAYRGAIVDPLSLQEESANETVSDLLGLCQILNNRTGAEIILGNFRLPPYFDPGAARHTALTSDYGFRKYVNLQLGLRLPNYVHVCDIEFLANRIGTLKSTDERTWFESKQPFSTDLMVFVAREVAQIVKGLKAPAKKVVVLDLDNTLWGGVVGDDGLEGIEIGTTSPRGEAFRHFQQYLLSLTERGILLAVCSKNDHEKAVEPFLKHPEMVLRLSNIVNFKANWNPKSENIKQIATELSLGVDSFVFVDDNPAEIEIVRQFVPDVTCICIGEDPSTFASQLQDSRLFELRAVTKEDVERVELYQKEAQRQVLQSTATDMDSYLTSLQMVAEVSGFSSVDVPRITQLINKSNQFNLTTVRRTESEVLTVANDSNKQAFTVRLSDKFGAHGLIAIVIGSVEGELFVVDTWLMSCRVLKRQVEELTLNKIVALAKMRGCSKVVGVYKPTAKNGMVRDLYPTLGFAATESTEEFSKYVLEVDTYVPIETKIAVNE